MKKRNKKIFKLLIIFIILIVIIIAVFFGYKKIIRNKFKNILVKNDATNYELQELSNDEEINTKVKDKILVSQTGNFLVWVSEIDSKRVILDTEKKTAIITENDEVLKVNSLNYTYIEDYFDNSNQKFKYLGKKDGYHLLQFTNKQTGIVTCLYLNIENNLVEKKVETANNGAQFISTFEAKINSVSNKEVEYPDLTDYHALDSASSGKKD